MRSAEEGNRPGSEDIQAPAWWMPAALLIGSFALHVLLMPSRGWEQDLNWFTVWTREAIEHGVAHVAERVWCDYPPVYLYLLKGAGLAWISTTGDPLFAEGSLAARFVLKLLPALADVGTAALLYRMALPQLGKRGALIVLAAYAYNPAMLFNSAVWGQADSLMSLLALSAVWLTVRLHVAVGFGFLATAILLKQQAFVLIPALALFTFRLAGVHGLFVAARGAVLTAVALLAPFYLAGTMERLITTMATVADRYPYISMNAHNVWWFIWGDRSPVTSDLLHVGNGLLTYRAIGRAMLSLATGLILWRLWGDLKRSEPQAIAALCEACGLQIVAFYLFSTQMHERYLLPCLVFLAAVCIWQPGGWWIYALLSATVLISLASTLYHAYPQPLGPLPLVITEGRWETFAVAGTVIVLFVVLLLRRQDRGFRLASFAVAVLGALGLAAAATVPLSGPVRLCEWEPVEKSQQWGSPRRHRSVDDRRLSVGGFLFRHGIGTHAASRLTYHLNGAFRSFEALFGVDDEAKLGQQVQFRILVDGQLRFDSGTIIAGGFPRHLTVPVAGAEYLTLEVLDGGDGISADHADWLEPVLLR